MVKNLPANAGDTRHEGSIYGWGRSPEGGNGNPFQYSYLKNPRDRAVWPDTVHRVANTTEQLSTSRGKAVRDPLNVFT